MFDSRIYVFLTNNLLRPIILHSKFLLNDFLIINIFFYYVPIYTLTVLVEPRDTIILRKKRMYQIKRSNLYLRKVLLFSRFGKISYMI